MSRGFGFTQNYLLRIIGLEPMIFDESHCLSARDIRRRYGQGDGGSNVGGVRSLRRALFRLCEQDVIQVLGIKRPHSYRLHPDYVSENPPITLKRLPSFVGA
jgi:hypothetical protein